MYIYQSKVSSYLYTVTRPCHVLRCDFQLHRCDITELFLLIYMALLGWTRNLRLSYLMGSVHDAKIPYDIPHASILFSFIFYSSGIMSISIILG